MVGDSDGTTGVVESLCVGWVHHSAVLCAITKGILGDRLPYDPVAGRGLDAAISPDTEVTVCNGVSVWEGESNGRQITSRWQYGQKQDAEDAFPTVTAVMGRQRGRSNLQLIFYLSPRAPFR